MGCNKLKSIRICARTGMPASLVYGQTFHSFIKLPRDGTFNLKIKASQGEKEEHIETEMSIIDEISMLFRAYFAVLDLFLRKVYENIQAFGRLIVVLCREFFQIPPVYAECIYAWIYQSPNARPQFWKIWRKTCR